MCIYICILSNLDIKLTLYYFYVNFSLYICGSIYVCMFVMCACVNVSKSNMCIFWILVWLRMHVYVLKYDMHVLYLYIDVFFFCYVCVCVLLVYV